MEKVEKKLQQCEIQNSKVARKSVVAKIMLSTKMKYLHLKILTVKRPGTGLNPFMIEKLINKNLNTNIILIR